MELCARSGILDTTLQRYLANVPHCALQDLKKLEQEDIRSLRGQLGRLWHLRLGHPNLKLLRILSQIVPELKGITFPASIEDCHPRKIAKATKIPHKSSRRRATRPFELIYTDVLGDVLPPGFPDNARWCLAIFDDFTRFAFVYPMQKKTQVHLGLEKFYKFIKCTVPYDVTIKSM